MIGLFAFFELWGATLAVAAGTASIPVIIHLLNRRRFRIVTWAAMRFLLNAQRQNTRKMRLEQLILLIVRVLVVLLLIAAMASVTVWAENVWAFFWPDGAGPGTVRKGRVHRVLVLDGSLSMALRHAPDKTSFDRARDLALQVVRDAAPGDGFSVAVMKDSPVWIVPEPSQDAAKVAREIEVLKQAHGQGNVAATLNTIASKLGEGGTRFDSREVYIFTDMQSSTWLPGGSKDASKVALSAREKGVLQEIQKRARTIFVDVGKEATTTAAVTDLKLQGTPVSTHALIPISATVQNFGTEARTQLRVELLVGRARGKLDEPAFALRSAAKQHITLKPSEQATVNFGHKFAQPGLYAVQVRIEGDDLEPDDARTVIVQVKDKIPVMLVNGKTAIDKFETATEYVLFALNPFAGGPVPKGYAIDPGTPRTLSEFNNAGESKLAETDCIFLCDVGQLGTGEVRRLETHLRRGGGLVIGLGDNAAAQLELYDRLLFKKEQGLLPGKLLGVQQASPEHHFELRAPAEAAFSQPPLQAFADDDDRIALTSARFQRYVRVKANADAKLRTLLTYTPVNQGKGALDKKLPAGDPALLEWNPPLPPSEDKEKEGEKPRPAEGTRYRGKVVLVTSSLNMDWNSWPASPSYLAMMQELLRLAISGRYREHAYTVNQTLEEYLPSGGGELDVTLAIPGEDPDKPRSLRTQGLGDVTAFRWPHTDISGIYLLTVGQSPQEYLFAVNPPSGSAVQQYSESDLARVGKSRLEQVYEGWTFQVINDLSKIEHTPPPAGEDGGEAPSKLGPEIARYLLLALLSLLLLEMVLAWAFGHFSKAVNVEQPAAPQARWHIAVGACASVLFLLIAGVLLHAAWTGDFLSFAPDFLRSGIETALEIEPSAPGESTRWDAEFLPFLFDARTDLWLAVGLAFGALALVVVLYHLEGQTASARYKIFMGGLRFFLILLMLGVLLPRLQLHFERQGWPDIAILIDDSRSMSEADFFQDEKVQEAATALGLHYRQLAATPEALQQLQADLNDKEQAYAKAPEPRLKSGIDELRRKLDALDQLQKQIGTAAWRPSRLQLAQALLAAPEKTWLQTLLQRRMKVHVFHLDAAGRAVKLTDRHGRSCDLTDAEDVEQLAQAQRALNELQPHANESRLGTAVRQVLDYYRGSSLSGLIVLTDGVTTREESLASVAEHAGRKGVPLYFVGIGDDHPMRDLKLHDLQVEDTIYVGDRVVFECRLTGTGFKDMVVPVILKVREPDGTETELAKELVQVDPLGKSVKVRLRYQPTERGEKVFIVEAVPPKLDVKATLHKHNLRLQRTIFVQDNTQIKVLYVEGGPRFEYRYLKNLLERESARDKLKKSLELKVVLTEADPAFAKEDKTALVELPFDKADLFAYHVVILGDVDPRSARLGEQKMRDLADFVTKRGGGLLMLGGPIFSPHGYRNTPLAEVLPIETVGEPPEEPAERVEGYRLELTPSGRMHQILRLDPDDSKNVKLWSDLAPIYWWAEGLRTKPLAEVLAVHPTKMNGVRGSAGQEQRVPLIVQQFVGAGRCMFFGFDESWRWRFREDEGKYNQFWLQTIRYLARSRLTRTDLRLDRQSPYQQGEPIKVTVRFPDNNPLAKQPPTVKPGPSGEVKVVVEYYPKAKPGEKRDMEVQTLHLAKVEDSWGTYEGLLNRTLEGKYRFWLSTPDVTPDQPDGKRPSAEATVVTPPGEMERLRMNQEEMKLAAEVTEGRFCTLANAAQLPEELPPGERLSLNTLGPPIRLWSHWLCFVLVLALLTAEWVVRKQKHLL